MGAVEIRSNSDPAQVDLNQFTRDLPLPPRCIVDLSTHAFSGNLREVAKSAMYLVSGNGAGLHGMGFEVVGLDALSAQQQASVSLACEERTATDSGHTMRLKKAAIHTSLNLGERFQGETLNQHLVRYMKDLAQPGDIVLVSCGGKSQKFFSEFFENLYRRLSTREQDQDFCPFTHAFVVDSSNKLLHINFKGVSTGTWERRFLERETFESVALVRINTDERVRTLMAEEARKFSLDKKYNYWWGLVAGPLSLIANKFGLTLDDTSATPKRAVCIDFITEPALTMAERGGRIHRDVLLAVTPRDLLAARGTTLLAAGTLERLPAAASS